jgi:hypothetical protein
MHTNLAVNKLTVQIVNSNRDVAWAHGDGGGIACAAYAPTGVQDQIIESLEAALEQARIERSCFDKSN